MVLGAQLMTKTTNKSRTYFQRVTVFAFKKNIKNKNKGLIKYGNLPVENHNLFFCLFKTIFNQDTTLDYYMYTFAYAQDTYA
jgi:hypothetical protein